MLLGRGTRFGSIHLSLFAMALAALLSSTSAFAQGLGRIGGTVTDTTGATVSGSLPINRASQTINTTNLRIIVSIGLAAIYVLTILAGVVLDRKMDQTILGTLQWFLIGMLGIDAAQFTAKRFSDTGYAAAARTPAVSVAAPATVTVATDKGDKT